MRGPMIKKICHVSWLKTVVIFVGAATIVGCAKTPSASREASLANLLQGDFVGEVGERKMYHRIRMLTVPSLGGEVIYHHISTEAVGGAAAQRKVYRLSADNSSMSSVVPLTNGMAFENDAAMVKNLENLPDEVLLRFPEQCAFRWKSIDGVFIGEVSRDICSYSSPAFDGTVNPEMRYEVTECSLKIYEGIFRPNGEPVFPPLEVSNARQGDDLSTSCAKPAS